MFRMDIGPFARDPGLSQSLQCGLLGGPACTHQAQASMAAKPSLPGPSNWGAASVHSAQGQGTNVPLASLVCMPLSPGLGPRVGGFLPDSVAALWKRPAADREGPVTLA